MMKNTLFFIFLLIVSCGGGGGNGSGGNEALNLVVDVLVQGVVVDGYISGATVFFDENSNLRLDSSEISTTSDSSGKFSLTISNDKTGSLVALGGTDLESSITESDFYMIHQLSDFNGLKVISPLTTIDYFYKRVYEQAFAHPLNETLRIESSVDIYREDPLANDARTSPNTSAYVYEKGVQLVLLARAAKSLCELQTNFDSSYSNVWKKLAISVANRKISEPAKRVNIESREFIEMFTGMWFRQCSSLPFDDVTNIKTDFNRILSNVLPLIEKKIQNKNQVQKAIITWANTDLMSQLISLSQGTLDSTIINSLKTDIFNYVSQQTGINSVDIVPSLNANPDSIVTNEDTPIVVDLSDNDDYIPSIGYSYTVNNPTNGSISLNDKQLTYSPNLNYSGNEEISYNLTQNLETVQGTVTILVNPVNDAPEIDYALPISADENQTSVKQFTLTDVDTDVTNVSISLSGTDANYFNLSKECISGGNCYATLSFKNSQDYEIKSSYLIDLVSTDGTSTRTTSVTINLNNLNDNSPLITQTVFTIPENQIVITDTLFTDPDCPGIFSSSCPGGSGGGTPYSWNISGTDQSCVRVTNPSVPGTLEFVAACPPNFEVKNSYSFSLEVSDGTYSDTGNFVVNLTDVNDAPILTNISYDLDILPTGASSKIFTFSPQDDESDPISMSILNNPVRGTASLSGNNLTFTTNTGLHNPELSEVYTDTVTVRLNDGKVNNDINVLINYKSDPYYQHQWHLNNRAQNNFASNAGNNSADLNLDTTIASGYDGDGVTIAIIDSGTEIAHEDLVDNILENQSYDFGTGDTDPTPLYHTVSHAHGTAVAGIAAARGWNDKGGRGVAPKAKLVAYNLLGGENLVEYQTTINIIDALGNSDGGANTSVVDIFNMSFGSMGGSDFDTSGIPTSEEQSFINGTQVLRGGLGALYIKSSGNSWADLTGSGFCAEGGPAFTLIAYYEKFSCTIASFDTMNTEPYLITTASLNAKDERSSYSTPGTSVWISGYGGEFGVEDPVFSVSDPALLSTDLQGCDKGYASSTITNDTNCNYTHRMNGTSAAAPTISGAVALILEANPNLTWRDVKHILASTATQIDSTFAKNYLGNDIYKWTTNAAGFKHHPSYGFGKADIASAITAALAYNLGSLGSMASTNGSQNSLDASFNSYARTTMSGAKIAITAPSGKSKIDFVKLSVGFTHPDPEHVMIELVSPDGTIITVLPPFTLKTTDPSGSSFDIGINSFYKENIAGDWTIIMSDLTDDSVGGTLNNWGLKIYGH